MLTATEIRLGILIRMDGTLTRLMTKGHSVWKGDLNVRRKSYLRRRKENGHKDSGDLRERAGELHKSVQDIRDMRNDNDTEYRYVSTLSVLESKSDDNGNSEVIYLHFQNVHTQIHESKHGGQHARGEIDLVTKQGYGVRDEIDAYRAQYSWFGKLQYQTSFLLIDTITEIGKVDSDFVHAIFEDGHALYPPEGMHLKDWYNN